MSDIEEMLARVRKQREAAEAAQTATPVEDPIAQGAAPAPEPDLQAAPTAQAPKRAPEPQPGPASLPVAQQPPVPPPGSEFGAVGSPEPFAQTPPQPPVDPVWEAEQANVPQVPGHPETTWAGRAARITVQRKAAEIAESQKPSGSMLRGFNSDLANLLGLPAEVVNEALGFAGYKWLESGDAQRAVRDGFRMVGIPGIGSLDIVEPGQGDIWDQIGSEVLTGVLTFAGLRGMSPSMAARPRAHGAPLTGKLTLGEKVGNAAQTLGAETLKRPMTSLVGNVTAAPGTTIGGQGMADIGGDFGEKLAGGPGLTSEAMRATGRLVGEVGGGLATGLPGTALLAKAGRTAFERLPNRVANKLPVIPPDEQGLLTPRDRSIIAGDADPGAARAFASHQIQRETEMIDRGIADAIERIAPDTPIAEVGATLRKGIERAEQHASRIVDAAWNRTGPIRRTVAQDMDVVEGMAARIRAEMYDRPSAIPTQQVDDILVRAENWRNGEGPGLRVGSLLDMRSELLAQARMAARGTEASGGPNAALERNLYRLVTAVEQDIDANTRHLTGIASARVKQALAVTRYYHDQFSRGPVGELLRQTGSSTNVTDPGLTVGKLMSSYGGTGAVKHLTERIPRSYMRKGSSLQGSPEAFAAMDQGISKSFQDELADVVAKTSQNSKVNTPDAVRTKALKIRPEYVRQAKQYALATDEINKATRRVTGLADRRTEVAKSALARVAAQEPAVVVNGVLAHPDSTREATRLMRSLSGDPAAEEGFRMALVEKIIGVDEGRSLAHVNRALADRKQRGILEAVLTPDQFERIQRMAQSATQLAGLDPKAGRSLKRKALDGVGTVLGMHLGRGIAHALAPHNPAASLKWPGTGVRLMQNLIQKALPEIDPHKAFVNAIFDPHWERWLNAKIPSNRMEAARYFELQKRAMFSLQTARDRWMTLGPEVVTPGVNKATEIFLTEDGQPPR